MADGWASCGKSKATGKYTSCLEQDVLCGKLQCKAKSSEVSLPVFPLLGTNRGKRTVTVYGENVVHECIQGRTTTSLDVGDPTLTGIITLNFCETFLFSTGLSFDLLAS